MSETKKGLLPWPVEQTTLKEYSPDAVERWFNEPHPLLDSFVRKAKAEGKAAHVRIEGEGDQKTAQFVREAWQKKKADEDNGTPVIVDADPSDPIFFGLPFASAFGVGKPTNMPNNKVDMFYLPLEEIEGVKVKWIGPDLPTGCGVYLRLDAYDPSTDANGAETKELIGVK